MRFGQVLLMRISTYVIGTAGILAWALLIVMFVEEARRTYSNGYNPIEEIVYLVLPAFAGARPQ